MSQCDIARISRNSRCQWEGLAWKERGFCWNLHGVCEERNPFFCLNANVRDIKVALTVL